MNKLIESTELQPIQTSPMHRDSSEAAMTTQASRNLQLRQDDRVELRLQARTIERFEDKKTFCLRNFRRHTLTFNRV